MVAFSTITQGINLLLLTSCMVFNPALAAPVADSDVTSGSKSSSNDLGALNGLGGYGSSSSSSSSSDSSSSGSSGSGLGGLGGLSGLSGLGSGSGLGGLSGLGSGSGLGGLGGLGSGLGGLGGSGSGLGGLSGLSGLSGFPSFPLASPFSSSDGFQQGGLQKLSQLMQKFGQSSGSDSSSSGLGGMSQFKDWFSKYKDITKFDQFGDFKKFLENGQNKTDVSKRDSVAQAATAAQIAVFKKYAGVASAAYCTTYMPSWSCSQCKRSVPDGKMIKTFRTPLTDTNGFIMTSAAEKTIYLSFRGSISAQNWMTDFSATPTSYPAASGATVHKGFNDAIKDSVGTYYPILKAQLDANPDYKILVTGHSLGGALAVLGGMDLTQRDKRITSSNLKIFTYGGPRVGNKAFANYVVNSKVPVFRSVNKSDPIPQTPPPTIGFVHPGVEAWKKVTGNVQICNTPLESKQCSSSAGSFALNMMDHMQYYDIGMGTCF